jgi:WD40-like Beta Propeller Repeat/Putative metal-binding motif
VRIRCLLAGAVGMALVAAAPALAAFPGANGRIAIQSTNRLDTINSSGGDRSTVLGPATGVFFSVPAWSPDGTRIAFASNKDGADSDLYAISFAGGALTTLTTNAAEDGYPTWSPDGTRIAFESDRDAPGTRNQIYVMNADGSGAINISSNALDETQPSWSPDGTRIAFVRGGDIWVRSPSGGQGTPLTSGAPDDSEPDWSPDGSKIVFQRDGGTILVMAATGENQTPLPLPNGSNSPAWSPDGGKILFESGLEIFAANADGSGATPLTTGGASGFTATNPDWQPIPAPPSPGGGAPPPPGPVDGDGDGVPAPADCNDADPKIRPGVRDKPGDKVDQNCDSRDARVRPGPWSVEAFTATYPSGYTTFTSMNVTRVKRGDRMRLTCKGRGCGFKQKSIRVRKAARKLSLLRHLKGMKLRKGAVIELRITRRDAIGKIVRWQIRAPKIPKLTRSCLRPGAKKISRCPN